MCVFLTHGLREELPSLRLTPHWQQSQAQVKGHKPLHAGKVLLTQPAALHKHQLLATTATLKDRCAFASASWDSQKKKTVLKTDVSEAN